MTTTMEYDNKDRVELKATTKEETKWMTKLVDGGSIRMLVGLDLEWLKSLSWHFAMTMETCYREESEEHSAWQLLLQFQLTWISLRINNPFFSYFTLQVITGRLGSTLTTPPKVGIATDQWWAFYAYYAYYDMFLCYNNIVSDYNWSFPSNTVSCDSV